MPRKGTPRLLGAVLEAVAKLEECKVNISPKKIIQMVEIALRTKDRRVPDNLKDRINNVIEFGVKQGILIHKKGVVRFVIGPRDIVKLDRKMGIGAKAKRKDATKKMCKGLRPRKKACKKPTKDKRKMKTKTGSKCDKRGSAANKKKSSKKKNKESCERDTDSNSEEEDEKCNLTESFSAASDLQSTGEDPEIIEDDDETIESEECQSDNIRDSSDTAKTNSNKAQKRKHEEATTELSPESPEKQQNPLSNEHGDEYTEDNSDEKMHLDEDELEDMDAYDDDDDDPSSMDEDLDLDMDTDVGMMDTDPVPCSSMNQRRYIPGCIDTNSELKRNKRTTQYNLGVIQGKVAKQYEQKKKVTKSRSRIREPEAGAELLGADPNPLNHPLILDYYRNGRFKSPVNLTAVTSKKSGEKKGNASKCEMI